MNEKVEKFLQEKQAKEQEKLKREMGKTLIELGLYEKEYSPNNSYSEEYSNSEYDSKVHTTRFYKKVPLEVTAEEYEKIKPYAPKDTIENSNTVASILVFIAVMFYIAGFIAGVIMGEQFGGYNFSYGIAFACWIIALINGTTFLGFAEIIKLLNNIKNK